MLTATVIGNVWATRRLAELPNGAFLEVEAEGTGQRLIAFDVLGSGVGERVLVTQGRSRRPGSPAAAARRRADHRLHRSDEPAESPPAPVPASHRRHEKGRRISDGG